MPVRLNCDWKTLVIIANSELTDGLKPKNSAPIEDDTEAVRTASLSQLSSNSLEMPIDNLWVCCERTLPTDTHLPLNNILWHVTWLVLALYTPALPSAAQSWSARRRVLESADVENSDVEVSECLLGERNPLSRSTAKLSNSSHILPVVAMLRVSTREQIDA